MASVEQVLEQKLVQAAKVVEDQLDTELERLEKLDEDDLEMLRRKRLEAMKKMNAQKQEWLSKGHGEYSELTDEKEFFNTCNTSGTVVCHFYRDSTFRCKIIDKHLSILASKHLETKFCKMNVEKSPFLTDRLKIRVLPTIISCLSGTIKDRIVGFDDLGGHDEFSTEMLEWRLAQSEVIHYSGDLSVPPDSGEAAKTKRPFMLNYGQKNIRGKGGDDDDSD